MKGTFCVANHNGDIQLHWTDETVWFDFDGANKKEKKHLSKFFTQGRKSGDWEAYIADEEGKPTGEPIKVFPKTAARIVLKRKPFEIKNIVETFVNQKIDIGGHMVFQMEGQGKGTILKPGDFKVEDKPDEKQEVVAARRPGGG